MEDTNYRMNVTRDNFSTLTSSLALFENYCNDCDIQHGQFRCRTNDRQAVISMDVSSILETNSLRFTLLKNKISLMKSFELNDNVQVDDKDLIIVDNESNLELNDALSKMIFRKPVQKYMDNKFITDSEWTSMFSSAVEENLIFSHTISSYIKKRISNATQAFMTDIVECKIIDNKAILTGCTKNKEDTSEFIKGIVLNQETSDKKFDTISMPYVLDIVSDIKLSVYRVSNEIYMCKFEQDFFELPVIVYTQVKVTSL